MTREFSPDNSRMRLLAISSSPIALSSQCSGNAMAAAGPGEPLTSEKVEKLAQEIAVMEKPVKRAKGLENIRLWMPSWRTMRGRAP